MPEQIKSRENMTFFNLELERYRARDGNLNKKGTVENLKLKSCFIKKILSIGSEVNLEELIYNVIETIS